MTLDTEQLYQQLNHSISVGIEDLFVKRFNKIFSIENDVELIKGFIEDILYLLKKLNEINDLDTQDDSFALLLQVFDEFDQTVNRYSDITGINNPEINQLSWFIHFTIYTLKGFEKISKSFQKKKAKEFMELFYDGINIIVEVLENSVITGNVFYLDTDIGNVIKYFILNSEPLLSDKISHFNTKEFEDIDFAFFKKHTVRAYASAREVIAKNNTNTVRDSTIKDLYDDNESYVYMENQGKLFDSILPKLKDKYQNMYVHFENGKVLDYDEDENILIDRVLENNNYQDVFIERVI